MIPQPIVDAYCSNRGSHVRALVGVNVGALVGVRVGVLVAVGVAVRVSVAVAVLVGVGVGDGGMYFQTPLLFKPAYTI
jgi:hypothetical protein